MGTVVTWLVRTIGIGGCAFLGLWVYDWGIPGASRIPYLSSLPIIGDITTGRAHRYAADQVKLATQSMVSKFENDVLRSQLAKMERDRIAAAKTLEEYRKRAEADERQDNAERQRLEKAIADDIGDGPVWTDADKRWLCDNGIASECGR